MMDNILKHHAFHEGDVAPDFSLPSVDGQPVSLSSGLVAGHRILLVFLRHLG
jgi:peroxiredoxin